MRSVTLNPWQLYCAGRPELRQDPGGADEGEGGHAAEEEGEAGENLQYQASQHSSRINLSAISILTNQNVGTILKVKNTQKFTKQKVTQPFYNPTKDQSKATFPPTYKIFNPKTTSTPGKTFQKPPPHHKPMGNPTYTRYPLPPKPLPQHPKPSHNQTSQNVANAQPRNSQTPYKQTQNTQTGTNPLRYGIKI